MNLFDLYAKIILDTDDYESGLEGASKKTNTFADGLKRGLATTGKVAAAGLTIAGTAITALGKVGLDYNMQMESYEANFSTLLGSFDAGKQKVAELADFAAKTPFEMTDLASATQELLGFNVASEDTSGVLKRLGDISLGNADKLASLTRAYGKMNVAQKVTLEDINMMIDAGYNPLLNISEKTGESMTSLYDRISKGKVSFEEIQEAIEAATSEGGMFFNGMEVGAKTTQGLISTLKDNATALVGKVFTPVSEGLTKKVLPAAIEAIEKLTTVYEEEGTEGMITAGGSMIGAGVGTFLGALPQFIETAGQIVKAFLRGMIDNQGSIGEGAAQIIMTLVTTVISLFPTVIELGASIIFQIISGVLSVIGEITGIGAETITEFVNGLVNRLSDAVNAGTKVVDSIKQGVSNAWGGLVSWWNGLWNSVFGNLTASVSVNKTVTTTTNYVRGGDARGSHAGGLDYVPYDGYIAELHRGEKVLTRSEADSEKRNRGGVTFGDVNIHVNGANYEDEDSLAEALAEKLRQLIDGKDAVYA